MKKLLLLLVITFSSASYSQLKDANFQDAITTTASGSLNQGIQQSIELVTLSNTELTALTFKAVTYPNPTIILSNK